MTQTFKYFWIKSWVIIQCKREENFPALEKKIQIQAAFTFSNTHDQKELLRDVS